MNPCKRNKLFLFMIKWYLHLLSTKTAKHLLIYGFLLFQHSLVITKVLLSLIAYLKRLYKQELDILLSYTVSYHKFYIKKTSTIYAEQLNHCSSLVSPVLISLGKSKNGWISWTYSKIPKNSSSSLNNAL